MIFDLEKIKKHSTKCGVYIMKDINKNVLYVGKAINLRNRLKQYFITKTDTRAQISFLIDQVNDIETIIVSNNKEALILENTLIKKYMPKYNIMLKDDKTYISIMLNKAHKWPSLKLIRLKKNPKDKNLYFGPYTNTKAARSIKELLLKLFPLRQCSNTELKNRTRPCILYDIKKCIAPCLDLCTKKEYDVFVDSVINFLKGKDKTILKNLSNKMKEASKNLEYEKANEYFKLIEDIKQVLEKQFVDIAINKNIDVIGLYRKGSFVMIVELIFIEGKLMNSNHFSFSNIASSDSTIIENFILQNYISKKDFPKEILVPIELKNTHNLKDAFYELSNEKLNIIHPIKGKKKDLIDLSNKNAKNLFFREKDLKSLKEKQLLELQEILNLKNFPHKIICFDTSNISGTNAVAAMITYIDGEKDKKQTKLFKIKSPDLGDVPNMKETLYRHFSKLKEKEFPNLLVLDGGKAQLNCAINVLNELNIISIDVISISKEMAKHTKSLTKEKVFIKDKKDPIELDFTSPLLFLLQKIRDNAHISAISFHRKRRRKSTFKTSLDEIKGIGKIKKQKLLKHIKSIENLKKTKKEKLKKLDFLNKKDISNLLKLKK